MNLSAALPMYDADRAAVAAWWQVLARSLREAGVDGVPDELTWPIDLLSHWRDAGMLLSQTCGYPLVTSLHDAVQVVGALRYTAPGCDGIDYRSALVVRAQDAGRTLDALRGRVAVVNDPGSHSGCNALRGLVAPLARDGRFFAGWRVSGSHRASIAWVRERRADVAAIDCVTLAGWQRLQPRLLDGLAVLGWTPPAPGLPLVTAATTSADQLRRLRDGLARACAEPVAAPVREALFIDGFDAVDVSAWGPVDAMRRGTSGLRDPVEAKRPPS